MKLRLPIVVPFVAILMMPFAVAQSGFPGPIGESYVPRLSEIMNVIQSQHMKLWLAGKDRNWELATFEVQQLTDSLSEAAAFYSGIPSANIARLTDPIKSISDAIGAKDRQQFSKAVEGLTDGCNACHRSMGRAFIAIQLPPTGGPYGNQSFSPPGKK